MAGASGGTGAHVTIHTLGTPWTFFPYQIQNRSHQQIFLLCDPTTSKGKHRVKNRRLERKGRGGGEKKQGLSPLTLHNRRARVVLGVNPDCFVVTFTQQIVVPVLAFRPKFAICEIEQRAGWWSVWKPNPDRTPAGQLERVSSQHWLNGTFPKPEITHVSKQAAMCRTATKEADRQFPFPWQTQRLNRLNDLWVNPSDRRPITISTRKSPFRGLAWWWGRQRLRGVRDRFSIAVSTPEHSGLYRRFVARDAFDHGSAERARITSSTDRRDVALPDILRDDRRFGDPRRRRVYKPGGRGTGRRGWGSAPIRPLLNGKEADLFSEEEIRYRDRGQPQFPNAHSHVGIPR